MSTVASRNETGCIAFAGGGSGGHLSPGLAIAERVLTISHSTGTLFLCSQREIDSVMLHEAGAKFVQIPAQPLSLQPLKLLRFMQAWPGAKRVAHEALKEFGVQHVVSLGGFVTAPVVQSALQAGVPVTLLNLDCTPGRANRWVARRATRVWSAVHAKNLPQWDGEVTGFPVRGSAVSSGDVAECRVQLGLEATRRTLLVTGASQGATSLNLFLPHFAEQHASLLDGWQILHLAGSMSDTQILALSHRYTAAGVRSRVMPFLHRMGLAWGAADLAISRAGANSVAEVELNCVPCLFVPYPYHRDLHQRENARALVEEGAAAMARDAIDPAANMGSMGKLLETLIADGPTRDRMRAALQSRPRIDAAQLLAQRILASA